MNISLDRDGLVRTCASMKSYDALLPPTYAAVKVEVGTNRTLTKRDGAEKVVVWRVVMADAMASCC